MIPALVLAAGRSSRFGRPKAFLEVGAGETFIRRVLAVLRDGGASDAVVVVRPDDAALIKEVAGAAPFARAVVNPRADSGQLSSLISGLDAVDRPGVAGVIVTLVDVPLISAQTVRTLLERARASGAPIVRPSFGERHGHPVFFARVLFAELRGAEPSGGGAKQVVHRHALDVLNVEVNDPGVVEDVDTPEDYERLFGRR